ncbi:MAG: hypothetical protein PVI81_06010 [Anaerolineales bacterium]|jgi:hypothetical protein
MVYPTGRDEAYMAEIRRDRMREAEQYRLVSKKSQPSPLQNRLQSILGKLGSELQDLWLDSFRGSEASKPDKPVIGHGMAP